MLLINERIDFWLLTTVNKKTYIFFDNPLKKTICSHPKSYFLSSYPLKFQSIMSNLRFRAIESSITRTPVKSTPPGKKVSDYFASNVFTRETMQKYLPKDVFRSVMEAIETGVSINRKISEQVSLGMKEWALSHSATHYTHWFQPLTGTTAEKHDSFFELAEDNQAIE
ncbi:MAG: glutamine synthetase III, partial [Bacteroidia bacterium]|nr:glutamine synthetase III [Bacteroidia bacterium]